MTDDPSIDEAIAWTIRMRDPATADWEAFTAWLEARPEHTAVYDIVARADRDLDALAQPSRPALVPSKDNQSDRLLKRAGLTWIGAAAAAAFLMVSSYVGFQTVTATQTIETALGETRRLTLPDGTRIEINGGSRLTFDSRRPRTIRLVSGEALFNVKHDPSAPFSVRVGAATIRDVGTVFNLSHDGSRVALGVAQGAIVYEYGASSLSVDAGHELLAAPNSRPTVAAIDPSGVGDWALKRLVYDDALVADVATDLSRALGAEVDLAPALADRRFTGTLRLDGATAASIPRMAALMGLGAEPTKEGWRLVPLHQP